MGIIVKIKTIIAVLTLCIGFCSVGNASEMTQAVLFFVNQYRNQHGLGPLKMEEKISQQAYRHSQDMADHRQPFGHLGFNERFHYLRKHIHEVQAGAENVAYNYKTAKIVVDNWMTSRGHRQNILGHYNLTGIGIVRDKQGKLYYTQLFLKTAQGKRKAVSVG